MSSTIPQAYPTEFLPALTRYTRTEKVTAELTALRRLPRAAVLRRAAITDKTLRLERETLVSLTRAYLRAGDQAAADAVLHCLVERIRIAIRARLKAWSRLAALAPEDAESEAVLRLVQWVRNLTPTEEFWECNFSQSFNQRLSVVLKSLTAQMGAAAALEEFGEAAGYREDRFSDIEVQEAMDALCGSDPRLGEFLYRRMEGYSDVEIAEQMNVTTRTLRNWAAKAQALWPQEDRQ